MTNPALGVEEGCWSLSQISEGEGRQGTSWTRHQFIGQHRKINLNVQTCSGLWEETAVFGVNSLIQHRGAPCANEIDILATAPPINGDHRQRATPQTVDAEEV